MFSISPEDTLILSPLADSFSLYSTSTSPSGSSLSSSNGSATSILRSLPTFDTSNPEQPCLPTHQVFSIPEQTQSPLLSELPLVSLNLVGTKRTSSPVTLPSKRARTLSERIQSKDFIPPDVSGLSKREARLVKNRAAAFLSRQRKREEFETMEIRVAELEKENARLLAIAQTSTNNNRDLIIEIQELRTQLAAAEERELLLNKKISSPVAAKSSTNLSVIKIEETSEERLKPPASLRSSLPLKTSASLGLMVLLCALPTLLSMPIRTSLPTSFAIPSAPHLAGTSFDFNSLIPSDCDWTMGGVNTNTPMGMDDLLPVAVTTATASQKLEFSPSGMSELDVEGGLAGLDVSFDATPSDNGKILVRIHPSSSVSSRATTPGPPLFSGSDVSDEDRNSESIVLSSSLSVLSSLSAELSELPPTASGDPFLGVGVMNDFLADDLFGLDIPRSDLPLPTAYNEAAKKRVRIALRSLPMPGGEGGEWEVQVC